MLSLLYLSSPVRQGLCCLLLGRGCSVTVVGAGCCSFISRALSVKKFLQVHFIEKLNYMAVLSFFIPKLNSIQTLVWPVLYVYHVTGSQYWYVMQTDWQYSYYAKKIKGCLSREIIYIEHDILVQYLKYSHKKLFSTSVGLASITEFWKLLV